MAHNPRLHRNAPSNWPMSPTGRRCCNRQPYSITDEKGHVRRLFKVKGKLARTAAIYKMSLTDEISLLRQKVPHLIKTTQDCGHMPRKQREGTQQIMADNLFLYCQTIYFCQLLPIAQTTWIAFRCVGCGDVLLLLLRICHFTQLPYSP